MSRVSGAAASSAVRGLLTGPVRAGRVVVAVAAAVYLELDPVDGEPRPAVPDVVAVLGPAAVRVPIGILSPDGTHGTQDAAAPTVRGPAAEVGGGEVRLGDRVWRVARWWSPDVPTLARAELDDARLAALARRVPAGDGVTRDGEAALARALRRSAGDELDAAAAGLLGLGAGLTPDGDDVLAGALVGLAALDDGQGPGVARRLLGAAVVARLPGTTVVSAALLHQAVLGRAIPELVAVLGMCSATRATADPGPALHLLLGVGHSSGAALARGMLLALTAREGVVP